MIEYNIMSSGTWTISVMLYRLCSKNLAAISLYHHSKLFFSNEKTHDFSIDFPSYVCRENNAATPAPSPELYANRSNQVGHIKRRQSSVE